MTCEWQVGAQRHMICGNTVKERQESDRNDVKKVVVTVLKKKLLVEMGHREQHRSFRDNKLNPLNKWDVKKRELDQNQGKGIPEVQWQFPL